MKYIPRFETPSYSDKYWIRKSSGGYNPCIRGCNQSRDYVLPNCVGYVHGRFMEIMGATSSNLANANGGQMFLHTEDGYERGQTPQLGAVICWSMDGGAGHVAIVEQINDDGSIITSNSAYSEKSSLFFYTSKLYPPSYLWSNAPYHFQGFIYNPMGGGSNSTAKIEKFIEVLKSHIGDAPTKSDQKLRAESAYNYCSTKFVVACAKESEILGVVVPNAKNPIDFIKKGVKLKYGEFILGPAYGKNPKPEVGDIVCIRDNTNLKYIQPMDCNSIAVVTNVNKSNFDTVMELPDGRVKSINYIPNSKQISGYFKPDWSLIKNDSGMMYTYGSAGKFYDNTNTRNDATIRDVLYLDSQYRKTKVPTAIRYSVVNYTTLMSAILDDLIVPMAVAGSVNGSVNLDGVANPIAKIIISYLLDKGLPASAAVGIEANIYHESQGRADAEGDYVLGVPTSFGICQWHYGRGDAMKKMAGSNWKTNLTGQLDYLWYELENPYQSLLSKLKSLENTLEGAKKAADYFVREFEIPANVDDESKKRQASATGMWSQIVIELNTNSNSSVSVSGSQKLNGNTIQIPEIINQSGIVGNYTNYSYWFSRWANSSNQRRVADKWSSQGKPSNRNIATIDGYYLIAVSPIFGDCGDRVSVVLRDGTIINCIIADIKGADATSKYGHSFGNGQIDIIEWESTGSTTSPYTGTTIDLAGWGGKAVREIVNGGKYI